MGLKGSEESRVGTQWINKDHLVLAMTFKVWNVLVVLILLIDLWCTLHT